ncbi:MAG: transporter substrate-binding domain-containing protein [Motiliproteus sp.]
MLIVFCSLILQGCGDSSDSDVSGQQNIGPVPGTIVTSIEGTAASNRNAEGGSEDAPRPGDAEAALLSALSVGRYRDDLQQLRKRGVIRALVTYSQTDFFLDDGYIRGLQADALRAYQEQLNEGVTKADQRITVKYIPVPFNRLIPSLNEGIGDIAAALLTLTPERRKQVMFASGGTMQVNEVVVRHRGADAIETLDQLQGKIVYVLNGSSYAEHLLAYNNKLPEGTVPITIVEADARLLSEDILELVNAGVIGYTVIDHYKAELWAKVLKDLYIEADVVVSAGNQLGWAVRKDNPQLHASLMQFFKGSAKKGTLLGNMLAKRYLGSTRWISNPLSREDRDKLNELLPLFSRYGQQYGIDPLALAAQAYQESRFDQSLKSHRGALGIMQLLPTTASDKNVAIGGLDKIENNIHAGAKYLAFLRDRYFSDPSIDQTNRLFFSWAAYNAGPGNVRKMRRKAEAMGLDKNRWFGNVEVAAARIVGSETVTYVDRIFKYFTAYSLSQRLLTEKSQLLESLPEDNLGCDTPMCDAPEKDGQASVGQRSVSD